MVNKRCIHAVYMQYLGILSSNENFKFEHSFMQVGCMLFLNKTNILANFPKKSL